MPQARLSLADLSPLSGDGVELTPNGYLPIPARIARDGVQEYLAIELGGLFPDREWDSIVRVYRPPEEVFAPDALASFNRLPVTNNHPWDDVNAANWKEHAVGMTEGLAFRDGNYVAHTLLITDAGAVNDVQRGRRELSAGWSFIPDMSPGVTPGGETYDLVAREIRGNHIAIVDAARCGPECRAGDAAKSPALAARLKDSAMCKCAHPNAKDAPMANRTITIDGIPVETTDAGAAALESVIKQRDEARTKLAAAEAQAAADAANHTAALAAKDAQLAEATKKIPDTAALERMARDHGALVATAKAAVPALDATGKDADAIRKEVVLAKLGDAAKDYTADQVKIAFDIVTKDAKAEPGATGADALVPSGTQKLEDGKSPMAKRHEKLRDAWKQRPGAAA